MKTTEVFETYWRFAAERQRVYFRRMSDPFGPWTRDPILRDYRFTNAYRAADRVSQYLIRNVQYNSNHSSDPNEIFFRTLLFKIFNRIETWEMLERRLGCISFASTSIESIRNCLDEIMDAGCRIYSPAYIMPAPAMGMVRKHANHLLLLKRMMDDRLPDRIRQAPDLQSVYEMLLAYPGLGPFLAFQYTIDLNYSTLTSHAEDGYVVAGPGALDGISKCFADTGGKSASQVIYWMYENQESVFADLEINFQSLFGRRLQPIDCQNLFCEISKYARVAHPDVKGLSGRTRIKQSYRPYPSKFPAPFFPPKWGLSVEVPICESLPVFELM